MFGAFHRYRIQAEDREFTFNFMLKEFGTYSIKADKV